jgi:hypothetical protein
VLTQDLLLTLAEVAVTLVGFSALVSLFQTTRDGALDDAERFVIRLLIETGLQAAFFSVLPHTLVAFGLSEATVWRPASGVFALAGTCIITLNWRRARALDLGRRPVDLAIIVAGLAVLVVLALNCLGIGFSGTAGPYVLAVLWSLAVAAFFFLTIVAGIPR